MILRKKNTKRIICLITALAMVLPASSTVSATDAQGAGNADEAQESLYVPGEVLVAFEDNIHNSRARKAVRSSTDEEVRRITFVDDSDSVALIKLERGADVEEAAADIASAPQVALAQPNYLYSTQEGSDDVDNEDVDAGSDVGAITTGQWNLDKVDTGLAWSLIDELKKQGKTAGAPVTVGVLDTGVRSSHEDLSPVILKDLCVDITKGETDGVYPKLTDVDDGGHGTKVSGVIAALNNGKGVTGFASGTNNDLSRVVVADVFERYNNMHDKYASTLSLYNGIDYMLRENVGAKVINISLGMETDSFVDDGILSNGIARAWYEGTLVVCAAGNQSTSQPRYPGSCGKAVSVIGTNDYKNAYSRCRCTFSNYGDNRRISAPARGISTTSIDPAKPYTTGSSGTSFAAPTVTSVAAMMLYVNPSMTPKQLEKTMYKTATDLYSDGFDKDTGYGNVNAYMAVAAAAGVTPKKISTLIAKPTVKAYSAGYRSLRISWKESKYANGYKIYRSASKNGKYEHIDTVADGTKTTYLDTDGLKCNKKFFYKVKIYGTKNNRKAGSRMSDVTSAIPVPAKPDNFAATGLAAGGFKLTWKRVPGANGYVLMRAPEGSTDFKVIKYIDKGKKLSFKNSSVDNSKSFVYQIRAWRIVNGKRVYGRIAKATATAVVPEPTPIDEPTI